MAHHLKAYQDESGERETLMHRSLRFLAKHGDLTIAEISDKAEAPRNSIRVATLKLNRARWIIVVAMGANGEYTYRIADLGRDMLAAGIQSPLKYKRSTQPAPISRPNRLEAQAVQLNNRLLRLPTPQRISQTMQGGAV